MMTKEASFRWLGVIAIIVIFSIGGFARAVDIGPMTWTPRADWINVKSPSTTIPSLTLAATGNGTTDDTAALQAIFTYLSNNQYGHYVTIYFPAGTYKISSTLTITQPMSGLSFIGCGSNTIISWAGPTGGAMYASNGEDNSRYIGLVWEGNNTAAVAYECDPQTVYQGGIRHENESFRDINAVATYSYRSDGNGDYTTTPVPPTAAIVSGYTNNPPSYVGETQVWNCRFSNCTQGTAEAWNIGNFFCWFYDDCEFDNCGTGINLYTSGGNVITSCHFSNCTNADILGGGNTHIRHCTSTGGHYFFSDPGSLPNPDDPDVIEDCWVDSWSNTSYAMFFQRAAYAQTIFDCTFTNPPSGSLPPIAASTSNNNPNHILLSNNYASGLPAGTSLFNPLNTATLLDQIPPGLRFPAVGVKSASQTFLNPAAFTDGTTIIDISQGTYKTQWTYPTSQNGLPDISAALQSAVNQAITNNNGTIIYIPSGIYNVSTSVSCTGSNYTIEGNGFSSQLCWWGADNGSILSINSPKISVLWLRLTTQDNTQAGITATAPSTATLTFDGIHTGGFQTGNPGAGGNNGDAPGLVIQNLPAGSTVWAPHLDTPLQVKNCGSSQILAKYFAQSGTLGVSGTTAQTGFLGTIFTEGGQQLSNVYDVVVTDNQDLIYGDYYVEQDSYNFSLNRGSGTVNNGRVTVGGFNCASGGGGAGTGSQYLINVNNYAGRVFYGSAGIENENYTYPVWVSQTGTNPVDIDLVGDYVYTGWNFTLGTGANLIATLNLDSSTYTGTDLTDAPNPLTAANNLSIAQAFDHFRQLEAVDLSVQNGLSTDGPPIAQYPFEGNVSDMTGHYNATPTNVTYTPGIGSQAGSFDGSTSYAQISNPSTLPSGRASRTIAGWGRANSLASGWAWIASFGSPGTDQAMFIGRNGTTLYGGGYGDDLAVSNFWDNNWHFIVLTYDGTTANLYADGQLVASAAKNWNLAPAYAYIGKQVNGGEYWSGNIDQVQIFNYAISANDVASLYNRTKALVPVSNGLVAYWKLDELTGSSSADSSGNGLTGTWNNSPTFTTDKPSLMEFNDDGGLSLNGTNQYVSMGNPASLPSGTAARTLCGWAKASSTGANWGWIAAFGSPNTSQAMFIGRNGTTLYGGGYADDLTVANFWDGNWHFIALTYDGTTAKLYADGVLKASSAKSWNLVHSACYIGEQVNNGSEFWAGSVDDVRIYNRALSAAEISQLAGGNP